MERFAQGASSTAEPERPRRFSGTWARACCRILRARHSPRFGIDVETCARCGGRMRLLAFITDPPNVVRFLRHLGEATEPPPSSAGTMPARRSALRNSPSSKFRTRPTRRRLTPLTAGTPLERPTRRRSYGSFAVRKLCSPSVGPLAARPHGGGRGGHRAAELRARRLARARPSPRCIRERSCDAALARARSRGSPTDRGEELR